MKNHVPTQNDEMFRRESRARDETAHRTVRKQRRKRPERELKSEPNSDVARILL